MRGFGKSSLGVAAMLIFTTYAAFFQGLTGSAKSSLARSGPLAKQKASRSRSPLSAAQGGTGHTYAAFWEAGGGYTSTLFLRNKDTQNQLSASVVLFNSDGAIAQRAPLTVAASGVASLELGSQVAVDFYPAVCGGLMIEFPNTPAERAMGEVVIENYQNGIIFDLPLLGGYRYDTQNALYAPWWLPDGGTDGVLTLFNENSQSIMVSPSIAVQGVEQQGEPITLPANQTLQMSLRSLMGELNTNGGQRGFVTLRYSGPVHGLDPALLLQNPSNGFSLTPAFNARLQTPGANQTAWDFPSVFLASDSQLGFDPTQSLTAYALLSNGTSTPMSPRVNAYPNGGGSAQVVTLPIAPLAPLETRLVDLSGLAAFGALPDGTSHFALSVQHNGTPGALAVTVFSVGQTGDFVFSSQGTVHPSITMDSSYWDISGALEALLDVYNPGTENVQTTATLSYQTASGSGTYVLAAITLPPNGSQVVNLKELILSGIHDAGGNVIPSGVTFGTLTLTAAGGGLIVGGCTTFDPVRGGYGDTISPDCEICDPNNDDACDVCVDNGAGGTCDPDCDGDPDCCGGPNPAAGVVVVLDNEGFPVNCPSTGVYVRQMLMQVVDQFGAPLAYSPNVQEQFQELTENTCGNGQPVPASCSQTGDCNGCTYNEFLDTMSVSGKVCGSGISQSSGCGFSATSVWSQCDNIGSATIWNSPRIVKSNMISVNGKTGQWKVGTEF